MTTLVRTDGPGGPDLDSLRSHADTLGSALEERTAEMARVKSALELFRIEYRQRVGSLHDQLDQLELAIAEAELGELSKLVEAGAPAAEEAPGEDRHVVPPRFTTDGVRKLFRDVAKVIHPDLTLDERARERRHALMIEANRAYAMGDEEHLRWILQAWESSPEAVEGSGPEATRLRLARRVAQLEEHLERLTRELDALRATPLWQLKAMVDEASAKGKDLMGDMVARLKRDIMVASNRLDAMRPPG